MSTVVADASCVTYPVVWKLADRDWEKGSWQPSFRPIEATQLSFAGCCDRQKPND